MTPEHREARRRIKWAIARWQCLVPPGFDVDHKFVEVTEHEQESTCAETRGMWKYHHATVIWYLPTCASQTWAYIEATLVHELVHVLLDGIESHLPSKLGDTAEHVVEGVARAFLRTRKAGG